MAGTPQPEHRAGKDPHPSLPLPTFFLKVPPSCIFQRDENQEDYSLALLMGAFQAYTAILVTPSYHPSNATASHRNSITPTNQPSPNVLKATFLPDSWGLLLGPLF
ncbi:hypothetical protein I79_011350 [Cricetulus griseus]|uniref:Uncharacterized protein n=1 Tax=Cricetulus griseus TaxID=10029 RepID=G3HKW7_CRIGR|nr:hypothetical protein I79_011350 [Cricetulus griseus]